MGKRYPYHTSWKQNILGNFHIYGDRAIFLPFYDNQDTQCEKCDIEISEAVLICTCRNIKDYMAKNYNTSQVGNKI